MKQRRGIALITVLIVTAAVFAVLAVGLKMSNDGVLRVSRVHQRNAALGAAEAGVYEAMRELESDKNFAGQGAAALADSTASYEFTVENTLWVGGAAVVTSTGRAGTVNRTLRVRLDPDTEGFQAVSVRGAIESIGRGYINGISGTGDLRARPGHLHSGFNFGAADGVRGSEFNGQNSRLQASGDVSARSSIDQINLDLNARSQQQGEAREGYTLNKSALLDKTFLPTTTSDAGVYGDNHRFSGDVIFPTKVTIADGATIHIQGGNAKFIGGLEGSGTLVVDGDLLVQTTGDFQSDNKEGLTILADGSVTLKHPEAQINNHSIDYEIDEVGDYFAQMPDEALSEIAHGVPASAPRDGDFFIWFNQAGASASGDPEVQLWYDGNGTDQHPGLSESTKQWLESSNGVKEGIKTWIDNASE